VGSPSIRPAGSPNGSDELHFCRGRLLQRSAPLANVAGTGDPGPHPRLRGPEAGTALILNRGQSSRVTSRVVVEFVLDTVRVSAWPSCRDEGGRG
jgi:hypothetical protein